MNFFATFDVTISLIFNFHISDYMFQKQNDYNREDSHLVFEICFNDLIRWLSLWEINFSVLLLITQIKKEFC